MRFVIDAEDLRHEGCPWTFGLRDIERADLYQCPITNLPAIVEHGCPDCQMAREAAASLSSCAGKVRAFEIVITSEARNLLLLAPGTRKDGTADPSPTKLCPNERKNDARWGPLFVGFVMTTQRSLVSLELSVGRALGKPELLGRLFESGFLVELPGCHQFSNPFRNALAGGWRSDIVVGLADQQRDLTPDLSALLQLRQHAAGAAAKKFLVQLGHLARHHHVAFRPENVHDVAQRLDNAVRRLVKDLGARRAANGLEHRA